MPGYGHDISSKDLREVIQTVAEAFPFPGLMESDLGRYLPLVRGILQHVKPPAKILDFGAGPGEVTAIFAALGFECVAYDELQDDWHLFPDNRKKILDFARRFNITYHVAEPGFFPFAAGEFDLVMMHAVMEHLHDSPRELLNKLIKLIKPGGLFCATIPNAVNLRKRFAVMFGRTNYPNYELFFWYPDPWRGHVREYVRDDFLRLSNNLNLEVLELYTFHQLLRKLPKIMQPFYKIMTFIIPDTRDSWMLLARKNNNWQPAVIERDKLDKIMKISDPAQKAFYGE
jgi:SAM-dependent methyltransferase